MKKKYLLMTAMVVLYGVCAGLLYSACNSEEQEVNYDLDPSISGAALVPQGEDSTYTCTLSQVWGVYGWFTPDAEMSWSGGGTPESGSGSEFTTSWESSGSNTLTVLVDGSDTDTNINSGTIECTNVADYAVTVVRIASAASNAVICYLNTATVEGTPDPEPDFPPGNPVWSVPTENGSVDPTTGDEDYKTVFTPSGPSASVDDMEVKGECGTSSASAFITAVGVTGMTFSVEGEGTNTPADTLGFGQEGTATALVSPAGRMLLWSDSVILSVDPDKPPVIEFSAAEEADAVTVTVHPDSGSGLVQLTAVDSQTGCGWYKVITIGCSSCVNNMCSALGYMAVSGNGVNAKFSMGKDYGGGSAGFLHITASEMSPELSSPTTDSLPPSDGPVHTDDCDAHEDGSGTYSTASADYLMAAGDKKLLRQIKVPDGLVDIVVSNAFRYDMAFYPISAVGTKDQDGYYQPTGAPSVTYIIENPDASTNVYNRLRISKVTGSETNVSEFVNTVDGGTNTWTLATGNSLKRESVNEYSADGYINTLRTVTGTSNEVVSAVLTKSMQFPWGLARVEQITDPDGEALTTRWSYYTNAADAGRYSRVAMQINPDGSWQKHDYTPEGYPLSSVSSYLDATTNATAAEARATYYDYSLHAGETPGYRPSTARTVIETTLGVTNSITYRAFTTNGNGEREEITERAFSAGSSYGDPNNLRTVSTYYAPDAAERSADKLKSVQRPGGTLTTYTYENGLYESNADPALCSFTAGGTNEFLRTTVTHGTVDSPAGIAGQTTREVTIESPLGGQLMSETYAYTTNGYVRINWSVQILDETHRPVTVYNADGTRTDTIWGCCGKDFETDTTGLETDYSYDALDRMDITTRQVGTNAIMTTYTYDAAGRRIKTTVSADGLIQVTSNRYNLAGQLEESIDQQGITTAYTNSPDGLTNSTIRAGLTNLTVRYADGRTHYTEQNGERQQTYTYGLDESSPATAGHQTTTIYTGPEGTNSPAWQRTTTDFLGRTIRTERPGFGGATLITENEYNAAGHLIRTGEKSFAPGAQEPTLIRATLYEYDLLGAATLTAQDLNTNSIIELAGPDRVSSNATEFAQIDGDWFRESRSYTFPEDGSSAALLTGLQRQRLTGLGTATTVTVDGTAYTGVLTAQSIGEDLLGNTSTNYTVIDRTNKTVVQVSTAPDSVNDQYQVTINGLATKSVSKTGLVITYGYDALGRRIATTDPRTGTSLTHYNTKGQVDWVEDAATNRTTFVYEESTGKLISTTDALTNTTHQAYSVEGQLIATWGATYPVAYEYDAYDRMSSMYTLRDTGVTINNYDDFVANSTAFDKTSWFYEPATGLLTNKLYADGKGTSYTYTPDGKLATRTWARGITTTYNYDTCCGSLTNISYSDNTPSVSYTYDRLGRQVTITDALSTRTNVYDASTLALVEEQLPDGTVLTRSQDTLGRPVGLTVDGVGDPVYSVTYGYDTLGRFHSVSSSVDSVSSVVNYSYLPDSDLISGWDNGTISTVRSYEQNRNLLTDIDNHAGTNLISRFAYENDAIGRRTARVDSTPALPSVTNTFGYNIRSEVVAALMGGNDYGYAYDPIGNREKASLNAG